MTGNELSSDRFVAISNKDSLYHLPHLQNWLDFIEENSDIRPMAWASALTQRRIRNIQSVGVIKTNISGRWKRKKGNGAAVEEKNVWKYETEKYKHFQIELSRSFTIWTESFLFQTFINTIRRCDLIEIRKIVSLSYILDHKQRP